MKNDPVLLSKHPSQSFRIPGKIRAEVDVVEDFLRSEAARHGLSVSQVVGTMLEFAFQEGRAGQVKFPDLSRCRRNHLVWTWVEIPESERKGAPLVIPNPTPRSERPKVLPTRTVSYRVAPEAAERIKRLAADKFAIGEMLLMLLSHSMAAVQEGRAQLKASFSIEALSIPNNPASNGSQK
jgi:hypothetical protein